MSTALDPQSNSLSRLATSPIELSRNIYEPLSDEASQKFSLESAQIAQPKAQKSKKSATAIAATNRFASSLHSIGQAAQRVQPKKRNFSHIPGGASKNQMWRSSQKVVMTASIAKGKKTDQNPTAEVRAGRSYAQVAALKQSPKVWVKKYN